MHTNKKIKRNGGVRDIGQVGVHAKMRIVASIGLSRVGAKVGREMLEQDVHLVMFRCGLTL